MEKTYVIKSTSKYGFLGMIQGEWLWVLDLASAYVFMYEYVADNICLNVQHSSITGEKGREGEVVLRSEAE